MRSWGSSTVIARRSPRSERGGSFDRGDQHSDSDVDLLVEFDPARKTFDNFMHLSFFLEKILQRRVELVTTEALSPHIGPQIIREAEYVQLAG